MTLMLVFRKVPDADSSLKELKSKNWLNELINLVVYVANTFLCSALLSSALQYDLSLISPKLFF